MAVAKKAAPEKKPAAKAGGKESKPRRKGKAGIVLLMILIGALVPFGAPTLLLCLGLLPTLIVLVTDIDNQKSATATVGFLNFAGVVPFVLDLWERGQTMPNALAIAREPTTWLVMLGAAGVGQLLLFSIPPAMAMLTATRLESRLKTLKEAQEQLKQIWGADIATTTSLEEVRKANGG